MTRKKWTAQTEVTDSLLKFREKRKWQLSYRRYVLEKMPCEGYAPYFGLDIETLRHWFELQFTPPMSWDNFGEAWQFEHIVPSACFDYSDEKDLALCWSFINMRAEPIVSDQGKTGKVDLLAARPYFQELYSKTGFPLCLRMLEKIHSIELAHSGPAPAVESFLIDNRTLLEHIASFSPEEFNRLNQGMSASDILLERDILKKFGSAR